MKHSAYCVAQNSNWNDFLFLSDSKKHFPFCHKIFELKDTMRKGYAIVVDKCAKCWILVWHEKGRYVNDNDCSKITFESFVAHFLSFLFCFFWQIEFIDTKKRMRKGSTSEIEIKLKKRCSRGIQILNGSQNLIFHLLNDEQIMYWYFGQFLSFWFELFSFCKYSQPDHCCNGHQRYLCTRFFFSLSRDKSIFINCDLAAAANASLPYWLHEAFKSRILKICFTYKWKMKKPFPTLNIHFYRRFSQHNLCDWWLRRFCYFLLFR